MAKLNVERIGGLAGFGAPGSHVRSHGEIDTEALSDEDKRAVDELFQSRAGDKSSPARDSFLYRISRPTPTGLETIEVPEGAVPDSIGRSVRDELV